MFLTNFSVKRPVAMLSLLILIFMAGINAYRHFELENMPEVDIPFITITTVYPGASPREIEAGIAKKIEDAVSTIGGIKHVYSTCMENVCQTMLEFHLNMNVDIAAMDVRERIDLIVDDLPAAAEKPKIVKFDANAKPVITLLLVGNQPLDLLYDYADEILSDKLSIVSGVADVQVAGGEKMEVQIRLDREKMAASNMTVTAVIEILQQRNIKVPSGNLHDGKQEVSVTFDGEFASLRAIEDMEISPSTSTKRIYIRDIARVFFAGKEKRTRAFYQGKPVVNLKIVKKGDANAVLVVRQVKEIVEKVRANLPGGMELVWFLDEGGLHRSQCTRRTQQHHPWHYSYRLDFVCFSS